MSCRNSTTRAPVISMRSVSICRASSLTASAADSAASDEERHGVGLSHSPAADELGREGIDRVPAGAGQRLGGQ